MSKTVKLEQIPVGQLVPTPDNPRHLRKDKAFRELVESIRSVGVLQPLIARPMRQAVGKDAVIIAEPKGLEHLDIDQAFDLRAGHRRLAAAIDAGLQTVPVIVRDLDHKTAMEVTVSENLQRENLYPLEEAAGVKRLLDVGWELQAIADRLGKSPKWVARRARLGELSPGWVKAIDEESCPAAHWPATHLEVIARLSEAMQEEALADFQRRWHWDNGPITVAELEKHVAEHYLHVLNGAPWKLDDDTLVPQMGACTACTRRASCQPLLFDEEPAKGKKTGSDRCLDRGCYAWKAQAFAERKLAELRGKHDQVVELIGDGVSGEVREAARKQGAVSRYDFQQVKAGTKGALPGVIVCGDDTGRVKWLKPYTSSAGRGTARTDRKKGEPTPLSERRAALKKRRQAHVLSALRDTLKKIADGKAPVPGAAAAVCVELAVVFGTQHRRTWHGQAEWKAFDKMDSERGLEPSRDLVRAVLPVLADRINYTNGDTAAMKYADGVRICTLLQLDIAELEQAAIEAIPEPRAWAHLNADGTPKGAKKQEPPRHKDTKKAKKKAG